jgi:O-antigen ligase
MTVPHDTTADPRHRATGESLRAAPASMPHAGHVFAVAAGIGLPVSVFAPLFMAPLVVLAAVAVLLLRWRVGSTTVALAPPPLAIAVPLAALALWALATAPWSLAPRSSAVGAAQFLGILLCGAVLFEPARRLDAAQRRIVRISLLVGLTLGLLLLAADMWSGNELTRFLKSGFAWTGARSRPSLMSAPGRGATVLALSIGPAWPILLGGSGAPRRALLRIAATVTLVAGAAVAIFATISLAAKLALVTVTAVSAAALRRPRAVIGALAAVTLLALLLGPPLARMLPSPQTIWSMDLPIPTSTHHRLTIWRFVAGHIFEPGGLVGHGFDASRAIPHGGDEITVFRWGRDGRPEMLTEQLLPLHPHNGFLQIWLELGVPGALAVAAFLVALFAAIRRIATPAARAAATGTAAAALLIFAVSYGVWQSWWLGTLVLTACLLAATADPPGASQDGQETA